MISAPGPTSGSDEEASVDARWSRPTTVDDVPAIREFVLETCGRLEVSEDPSYRLTLAAGELCANVILHGYDGGPGPLEVRVRRTGTSVSLTVRDEAFAFDPTTARPSPVDEPLEDREPGGLGLLLVRQLVDGIEHARVAGGNEVTVTIDDPRSAALRTQP